MIIIIININRCCLFGIRYCIIVYHHNKILNINFEQFGWHQDKFQTIFAKNSKFLSSYGHKSDFAAHRLDNLLVWSITYLQLRKTWHRQAQI